MVLLAVYTVLLSKYSGQEDILVGIPIAGREHSDLENLMGLFINALPLRNFPNSTKTFAAFLTEVKENALEAFANQGCPFDDLVERITGKVGRLARHPIFDVELIVLNMEMPSWQLPGLKVTPFEFDFNASQMDISIYATEQDEEIHFDLYYCTSLFKKTTMQGFIDFFREIVLTVLENKQIRLQEIKMPHGMAETKTTAYSERESQWEF